MAGLHRGNASPVRASFYFADADQKEFRAAFLRLHGYKSGSLELSYVQEIAEYTEYQHSPPEEALRKNAGTCAG